MRVIWFFMFWLGFAWSAMGGAVWAQQASYGTTFIDNGANSTVFGTHTFLDGSPAALAGKIATARDGSPGVLGFASGSSWTGADNAKHVDGYARWYGASWFVYPVGDEGRFRAAATEKAATAAYYFANPNSAITTSFDTQTLAAVSTVEYWDIDVDSSQQIRLSWDATSAISALTGGDLKNLAIAGWNTSTGRWERIVSAVDSNQMLTAQSGLSLSGGTSTLTSGSILSAAVDANKYAAFTFARSKARLKVSKAIGVGGRIDAADQFTTQIKVAGAVVSSSGVAGGAVATSGTGNSFSADWLVMEPGTSVVITEIKSAGASAIGLYDANLECVNEYAPPVGASATPAAGVFDPATGVSFTLQGQDDINCLITNTAKPPKIKITKLLGTGGRIDDIDNFIVTAKQAVTTTATTTTTGTGSSIADNEFVFTGEAGLPYTVSEVMAAGAASPLNHYHASVTCTRTTGSTDVSAIASLPFTITPTNGDDIACTITNTQQPRLILNKKVGLRLDSNDQFTVAVVGTPLIAGTNTTATTTAGETEESTDNLILQHGSSYTLRDWVSSSTVVPANKISNYGRSLTCSNSRSGTGTTLPGSGDLSTNTALSPEAAEAALTVHAGDVISCTFANSARPALSVTKVVGLAANSADRFKISIRNTDGEARVQDDVSSEVSKSLTTDGVSSNTLTVKIIGTTDTGKTFVIEEEMTNATSTEISAYSTTLACTNTNSISNGGTDVSSLTLETVGSVRRTTFTLAAYGTDILNTGTALDNISCTLTNTASLPKMTVRSVSQDGVATFAYKGHTAADGVNYGNGFDALNLTTTTAGATVSSTTQFLDAADKETRIEQVPLAGWVLASASCTDNNAAQTGNPAGSGALGVFLPGVGVAVSKAQMKPGADIVCTFTSQKQGSTVSGVVFQDNGADAGAGAGTAHNGVQDGGEAGIGNVVVRLYNNTDGTCTVLLSEALTNGKGEYSLNVPVSVAANTPLCVHEQNAAGMQSVSFKSDSTAATYTRATDRATFTWMGVAVQDLNFGDVLTSRLDNSSQQIIKPGSTTEHAHRFVAGTAGSVTFSIQNAVSVPVLLGWSEVLYKDEDCSGTLDSAQGDAQLALNPDGSATVGVSAGGVICLIVRQFSPLAAPEDARRSFTLRAVMTHEPVGILGAISETLVQNDTARVSEQALHLLKQVCNFSKTSGCTQQADWLTSNSAQRGDTVQYRITYQNQGTSAISNLIIRDTTPNYTTFVGAECVTPLPSGLTVCSEARAEAGTGPAPGGVGNLMWIFTGTLNPSGKGSVQFRVLVE